MDSFTEEELLQLEQEVARQQLPSPRENEDEEDESPLDDVYEKPQEAQDLDSPEAQNNDLAHPDTHLYSLEGQLISQPPEPHQQLMYLPYPPYGFIPWARPPPGHSDMESPGDGSAVDYPHPPPPPFLPPSFLPYPPPPPVTGEEESMYSMPPFYPPHLHHGGPTNHARPPPSMMPCRKWPQCSYGDRCRYFHPPGNVRPPPSANRMMQGQGGGGGGGRMRYRASSAASSSGGTNNKMVHYDELIPKKHQQYHQNYHHQQQQHHYYNQNEVVGEGEALSPPTVTADSHEDGTASTASPSHQGSPPSHNNAPYTSNNNHDNHHQPQQHSRPTSRQHSNHSRGYAPRAHPSNGAYYPQQQHTNHHQQQQPHRAPMAVDGSRPPVPCRNWPQCKFGPKCRFLHPTATTPVPLSTLPMDPNLIPPTGIPPLHTKTHPPSLVMEDKEGLSMINDDHQFPKLPSNQSRGEREEWDT